LKAGVAAASHLGASTDPTAEVVLRKRDELLDCAQSVGFQGPERAQSPSCHLCQLPALVRQLAALFGKSSLEHREEEVLQEQEEHERATCASSEDGDVHGLELFEIRRLLGDNDE
jgi:hypothetical protein